MGDGDRDGDGEGMKIGMVMVINGTDACIDASNIQTRNGKIEVSAPVPLSKMDREP